MISVLGVNMSSPIDYLGGALMMLIVPMITIKIIIHIIGAINNNDTRSSVNKIKILLFVLIIAFSIIGVGNIVYKYML